MIKKQQVTVYQGASRRYFTRRAAANDWANYWIRNNVYPDCTDDERFDSIQEFKQIQALVASLYEKALAKNKPALCSHNAICEHLQSQETDWIYELATYLETEEE